jgi:hypothetical protein
MKAPVDARLTAEAERFGLRFACDDCAHFAPEREGLRGCGYGWPVRLRRSALDHVAPGENREPLAFCKEFELS